MPSTSSTLPPPCLGAGSAHNSQLTSLLCVYSPLFQGWNKKEGKEKEGKEKEGKEKKTILTCDLDDLQPPLVGHAQVAQAHLDQGLLLRLHYVRQARVAGLVESQVRRDHHGQLSLDRLDAAVDFLGDEHAIALELDLAGLGGLGPAQQAREHGPRLRGIVVDALLAQDHQVALLLVDQGAQHLGHGQRLQLLALLRLDVHGTVCAHGHGRPQDVLRLGRPRADDADVLDARGVALLLADSHRLLDRELVEGVHAMLDAGRLDSRLGLVDTWFDLS